MAERSIGLVLISRHGLRIGWVLWSPLANMLCCYRFGSWLCLAGRLLMPASRSTSQGCRENSCSLQLGSSARMGWVEMGPIGQLTKG